jgi:hypothetical protein
MPAHRPPIIGLEEKALPRPCIFRFVTMDLLPDAWRRFRLARFRTIPMSHLPSLVRRVLAFARLTIASVAASQLMKTMHVFLNISRPRHFVAYETLRGMSKCISSQFLAIGYWTAILVSLFAFWACVCIIEVLRGSVSNTTGSRRILLKMSFIHGRS